MPEITPSRYMVTAGWSDVPHLSEEAKRELWESTPPHLREARSEGTPSLGAGAIYPVPLDEVLCQPFAIPAYWPRCYGFDVGWHATAAVWVAKNPEDSTFWAYAEHKQGQQIPAIHATAIKARGDWIPGAIDPASRGRSQDDGSQLITKYKGLGLKLTPANNAVEEGIDLVWSLLTTGRLKFFTTLTSLQAEYRLYRREEKETDTGRKAVIVKKNDHCLDALRYALMTFKVAKVKPPDQRRDVAPPIADKRAGY